MSKNIPLITLTIASLFLSSPSYSAPKEISIDDANNKTFTKVCNTKYHVFITFKNISGYAEWPDDDYMTHYTADDVIQEAYLACREKENVVTDALNSLKKKWKAKCKAEICMPTAASNTGILDTVCSGGEATVTNKGDSDLKCTHKISYGKAKPRKLRYQTESECYVGDGSEGNKGYSSVLAYVPPKDETPKLYMNLDCRAPGYIEVLKVYDDEPIQEPPKKDK